MFRDMAEVRAANRTSGDRHWFEASAMRFFNSRVESRLYGGRWFITSERYNERTLKYYTVREAMPDGSIKTVGAFQQYRFKEDAQSRCRELVREARRAVWHERITSL